MASSIKLHVADHVFAVMHCDYGATQATQLRGRASARVSQGQVQLVLAVPDGNMLLAWAAAPYQRQATAIVFFDAGDQPFETLRLPAAYCVGYREEFVRGDTQDGAYRCILTLVDPDGWTLAPGGLASAFITPAGHSHGEPGATALSSDPPSSQATDSSSSPTPMDLDSEDDSDSDSDSDMDLDPEDEPEDEEADEDDSNMGLDSEAGDEEEGQELILSELLDDPFFEQLLETSDYDQLVADPALEKMFENQDLLTTLLYFKSGDLTRMHKDIISVWEQTVIAHYVREVGYKQFNLALRGQAPMTEFFRTQERIINGALKKLPKFQGLAMRGTGESEIPRFDNARVGDVIEYQNFVSTSTDENRADGYMRRQGGKYVLRITSKTSVQLGELAPAGEDEVLFQSKKKYRVTGRRDHPRFTEDNLPIKEIYLEEI